MSHPLVSAHEGIPRKWWWWWLRNACWLKRVSHFPRRMIHNEDEWGKKVLTEGRDEKHKGIKKLKKGTVGGRGFLSSLSRRLPTVQKGQNWPLSAFYRVQSQQHPLHPHPQRSLLLPSIISADITPWKDICSERERERMARCIIEQC